MWKTFLFKAIQFSHTVLIQTIRFSISMQLVLFNSQIGPLSGVTIPGRSGTGSNGNEGVLRLPQSPNITRTSSSDCLVSYPGYSLVGCLTSLQRGSLCILRPQLTGQMSCYVLFWTSTHRKRMKPIIPLLWVKKSHSTLELNKLFRIR